MTRLPEQRAGGLRWVLLFTVVVWAVVIGCVCAFNAQAHR